MLIAVFLSQSPSFLSFAHLFARCFGIYVSLFAYVLTQLISLPPIIFAAMFINLVNLLAR